jgi:hypothetical protein
MVMTADIYPRRTTSLLRVAYRIVGFCAELVFRCIFTMYYVISYLLVEMPRWQFSIGHRVHSGTSQSTGLWCILATAQGRQVSENLIAFLSCLQQAGYNVILVNNGNLVEELSGEFLAYCHSVIEKPRGGRDFGGYKWGTKALCDLERGNGQITQVVYCNDSIFVRPSTLALLLNRIRQMSDDYIGITDTFDQSYHVQSWFFVASGALFHRPEFQQFWRSYVPLSYRRHCIKNGEVGISRHLSKQGIHPNPLYTQAMILDLIFEGSLSQAVDRLLLGLSPGDYRELTTAMQQIAFANSPDGTAGSFLRRDIMEQIGMSNTMNTANLILIRYTAFPFLKKDLVYRGDYLFSQIQDAIAEWVGEDAAYLTEIFAYFRSRGTLQRQYSPSAILARMGLL